MFSKYTDSCLVGKLQWSLLVLSASLPLTRAVDCGISGAVYGSPYDRSAQFVELIGLVCGGSCYNDASQWSSTALAYGDRPVSTEEECAAICGETEDCDVWSFWPKDVGNSEVEEEDTCQVCLVSDGWSFDAEQEVCTGEECFTCLDLKEFIAGRPMEECTDLTNYVQFLTPCCEKDPKYEPGACELFTALPTNSSGHALTFGTTDYVVSGPVDCEQTRWLPFLQPTTAIIDEEVEEYDRFSDYEVCNEDWCNSWDDDCCANPTPNELWPEVQTCAYGSVVVSISDCWYTCCIEKDNTTELPTSTPTIPLPTSSDGRKCWIDSGGYSYGNEDNGACANARIVQVLVDDETMEVGLTQGWWEDLEENTLAYLPETHEYPPENCRLACLQNEACGGWEFHPRDNDGGGGCILKEPLDCLPKISRSSIASEVATNGRTYVGVRGCLEGNETSSNFIDVSKSWFSDCDLPRCTQPHWNGTYVDDTFIPTGPDSCWYKQFEQEEIYDDCAKGKWIVVNGGSNSLSFFTQLVNYFVPVRDDGAFVGFDSTFVYNMIDVVIDNRFVPIDASGNGIQHFLEQFFCDLEDSIPCGEDGSLGFQGDIPFWTPEYQTAIEKMFAKAPAYDSGYTRISLVVGQFWQNSDAVFKALANVGNGWENADITFMGQAMIWYPCNMEGWCTQAELGSTRAEVLARIEQDLFLVAETAQGMCNQDRFNCFFATHGYESIGSMAQLMIDTVRNTLSPYSWAHFIDINGFIPSTLEVVDGHVSPIIFATYLTMIWNTICDAPSQGCPQAVTASPTCFSECAEKGGGEACVCGGDWTCQNELECKLSPMQVLPWEFLMFDHPNYVSEASNSSSPCLLTTSSANTEIPTDYLRINNDNECNRVFCGTRVGGWILSLIFMLLGSSAVLLGAQLQQQDKKPARSTEEKPETGNCKDEEVPPEAPIEDVEQSKDDNSIDVDSSPEALSEDKEQSADDDSKDAEAPMEQSTDPKTLELKQGDAAEKIAVPTREHLNALGVARFLASTHIVLGHLLAKGATKSVYFFRWGFTWVPWFFVLSGYVLTHARINSSNPAFVEPPFKHIAKRLASIFPMYAFGVLAAMIIRIILDRQLPSYGTLTAQSFLLQSWLPMWAEKALVQQCWFLSNLLLYWFGFGWVYSSLRSLSLKTTGLALLAISFLPWLLVIVPAASNDISSTWYSEHNFGDTDEAVDIWTIMLKFHPIFYIHVFVFGMLLAVLRNHLKVESRALDLGSSQLGSNDRLLVQILVGLSRFGACLGYLGLILVFSFETIQPTAYKLSTRLSVLLPLQGLMLIGLSPLPQLVASGSTIDPLAHLFALAPQWIGDVSYCQYVLQFVMYDLFPVTRIEDPSFFLFLLGGSLLAYKLVQEPGAKVWRQVLKSTKENSGVFKILLAPSILLAVVLVCVKASYTPNQVQSEYVTVTNYTMADPYVRISNDAVDLRLNWTISNTSVRAAEEYMINPSILFREGDNGDIEYVRAVRMHAIQQLRKRTDYEGNNVTEITSKFESSIWLQSENFSGDLSYGFDEMGSWGLDGLLSMESTDQVLMAHLGEEATWSNLCEPSPSFNSVNMTLSRKQVTGPEDPKLIDLPKLSGVTTGWGFSFSSYPPAVQVEGDTSIEAQEECAWADDSVVQMYLAPNGAPLVVGRTAPGVRLTCGDRFKNEKNWIAFTHENSLYYIYSVEPHVVVRVRVADGECAPAHETTSADLQSLSQGVDAIRGSATAVPYSETEYLALLHTYKAGKGYSSRFYTFEAKAPFRVMRVSKPLELQGDGSAFVSSLAIQSDKVFVGYGEADKAARMLVMSESYLESLFDGCH